MYLLILVFGLPILSVLLVLEHPDFRYNNTVSSSLKRPGSPLYNEKNKRTNFIIDNIEPNNIVTDTPLTFKQAVSNKNKSQWISAMN